MKKIIIFICILLMIYSADQILTTKNKENENINVYSRLQTLHNQEQQSADKLQNETDYTENTDEAIDLIDINNDYLGWIYMDGTSINYPIVQSHDNKEYLTRNFTGQWSIYGTPFLDKDMQPTDSYKIIYGHSDNTVGQMFTDLKHLLDFDYYMQHKIIQCFDKDYEVVSVNVIDIHEDLPYWEIPQLNQDEQKNIIDAYKNASMILIESSNQSNDFILLSTCLMDAGEDTRLLVIAQCVGGSTSTFEGGSVE